MKKNLILSILVMTSLMLVVVGVSAVGPEITNVEIVPEYPNLDSDLVNVHASIIDSDGINYSTLYYKIGAGNVQQTTFTGPFSNGVAGIYYNSPQDGVTVSYHIKAVDNNDDTTWYPSPTTWEEYTYDGSDPTVGILGYLPGLIVDEDGVTVTITCNDSISGCDEIGYEVHDTNPGTCSQIPSDYTLGTSVPITGHKWICAYAKDYAGNEDFTGPVEFNVFNTIQDAIDDSDAERNTINVVAGTYAESVLIDKELTLIGDGTIITGASDNYIVKVTADNVVIDNVEVNGGGSKVGDNLFDYGILISGAANVEVKNSFVTNIWKGSSNGIGVEGSINSNIHDNTISSFHKRGIRYIDSSGVFYDNEIVGDNVDGTARVQNLVNLWGGSTVEIYENTLYNALSTTWSPTWDSPGIFVSSYGGSGDSYANIHDNEIYNCDSAIVITSVYIAVDSSSATITNNNIHGNMRGLVFERNTGTATLSGNTFTDNLDDFFHVIEIDGTSEFYGGIQYAIDNANPGATLNVYSGTYEEDLIITVDNLELVGEDKATTIIKGVANVPEEDWPLAIPNIEILADGVQIHGFTIEGPDYEANYYASGIVLDGQNVEIYDNDFVTVQADTTDELGQAITTYSKTAILTADVSGLNIHDNTFTGSGLVGCEAIYINPHTGSGTITIENNEFSGSIFIGISAETGNIEVIGNTIDSGVDNWYGIRFFDTTLSETYDNIVITENNIQNFVRGIRIGNENDGTSAFVASILSNTLTNNDVGIWTRKGSQVTATYNSILGNTIGIQNDISTVVNAINNWWGDLDPSDQVSGFVDYTPWAYAEGLYDNEGPTSTINFPVQSSLFASNFIVEITDLDTGGAELNLASCEYRVFNDGSETKPWTPRGCNDSLTLTVGSEMDCDVEGENVCKVEIKSVDNSGNDAFAERTFSIDWTNPPLVINSGPSGTIVNDWVVLHVETNKPATCKYDTVYKSDYSSMNDYMNTTEGTISSQLIEGLQDKQYAYYILCEDSVGNEMTQTVTILFDVDTRENFVVTIPETKGDYLSEGWNQFFLPSFVLDDTTLVSPYDVEDVLESIEGMYNILYHFDGEKWRSYKPERPVNDLPEFTNFTEFNGGGFPYFIYMNVSGKRIEIQ